LISGSVHLKHFQKHFKLKVSIITVTFNSEATLEETILSVMSQDYSDIEFILIDGGSTDGTLEIAAKYSHRIAKLISEKDKGLYDALNKGIAYSEGDIIGILHSDDFFTGPSVISSYVAVFNKQQCDAVYADLHYVGRKDTGKVIRKWISGSYTPGAFLKGWMPPHPTFFVRKEIYSRYGGFNLNLKSAADYELMLRLIHKHRINIAYLREVTVKMRVGGKSNLSLMNRLRANMEDRKAWKMNGLRPGFMTLFIKPFRKLFQYF
jgi:glycosyltransferase involved in cell wall biosynthesis